MIPYTKGFENQEVFMENFGTLWKSMKNRRIRRSVKKNEIKRIKRQRKSNKKR